jgi:hypothetical protein
MDADFMLSRWLVLVFVIGGVLLGREAWGQVVEPGEGGIFSTRFGWGLNEDAANFFANVGVGWRY